MGLSESVYKPIIGATEDHVGMGFIGSTPDVKKISVCLLVDGTARFEKKRSGAIASILMRGKRCVGSCGCLLWAQVTGSIGSLVAYADTTMIDLNASQSYTRIKNNRTLPKSDTCITDRRVFVNA